MKQHEVFLAATYGNSWSSQIQEINILEVQEAKTSAGVPMYLVHARSICRITLANGSYRENCGHGTGHGPKKFETIAAAEENAVDDALKKCADTFERCHSVAKKSPLDDEDSSAKRPRIAANVKAEPPLSFTQMSAEEIDEVEKFMQMYEQPNRTLGTGNTATSTMQHRSASRTTTPKHLPIGSPLNKPHSNPGPAPSPCNISSSSATFPSPASSVRNSGSTNAMSAYPPSQGASARGTAT